MVRKQCVWNRSVAKGRDLLMLYRGRIIFTLVFVFLFHGAKLNSQVIGIDTEDIIKLQEDFYGGWLTTGRQGLVFLKGILGMLRFNPYFAGLMTLILLGASSSMLMAVWDRAGGKSPGNLWGWCAGGLLWLSHPVMTEQMYFSLQSAEICMGILLLGLALYFGEKWTGERKFFFFLAGVLTLLVTLSLYQAFAPMYIFGAVSLLLLAGMAENDLGARGLLKRLFSHVCVFLAAFILNTLITQLFFGSSNYLQEQILWGSRSFAENLRAILGHIARVCMGYNSIYYSLAYGILCVFTAGLFAAALIREKREGKEKLLLSFFLLCLFLTPFLMTIICGGAPVIRSQLVLPVMTGFLAYFDVYLWRLLRESFENGNEKGRSGLLHAAAACMGLLIFAAGLGQLQVTCRLYYTDRLRYEQDVSLGRELITRIEQVRGQDSLPVIVIGNKEFEGNNATVTGEVIGRSFFDYDTQVDPAFYWSTRRILGFLHILGEDYAMVPQERVEEAMEYSTYMPEWPSQNSVQIWDGMIVVKLSHFE